MEPLRFYLDEDVNALLARLLRDRGVDAVATSEAGQRSRSDPDQLAHATSQGRVLVTFNVRDYVRLAQAYAEQGRSHAGIVVSDQLPAAEMLRRLLRLRTAVEGASLRDQFFWLQNFA